MSRALGFLRQIFFLFPLQSECARYIIWYMSNKSAKWRCNPDDHLKMQRQAIDLGGLDQPETFALAVKALQHQIDHAPKTSAQRRRLIAGQGRHGAAGPSGPEPGDGEMIPYAAFLAYQNRKSGKPAKPPKPDPLAQAIAESRERTKGLEDLQAKLSKQAKDKAEAKALAAEIAALRAKWPIEAEKPKAAKAGRKVK